MGDGTPSMRIVINCRMILIIIALQRRTTRDSGTDTTAVVCAPLGRLAGEIGNIFPFRFSGLIWSYNRGVGQGCPRKRADF